MRNIHIHTHTHTHTHTHSHMYIQMCKVKERKGSHSVVSDSLRPYRLQPTRFHRPWDFPGKNIGVGCYFFLQEIFPTEALNPGRPHCRQKLYRLSHQGQTDVYICVYSHTHKYMNYPLIFEGDLVDKNVYPSILFL